MLEVYLTDSYFSMKIQARQSDPEPICVDGGR